MQQRDLKRNLAMTLKEVGEYLVGLNEIHKPAMVAAQRQLVTLSAYPTPDENTFRPVALFVHDFNGSTQAVEARVALDERPDYNRSRWK